METNKKPVKLSALQALGQRMNAKLAAAIQTAANEILSKAVTEDDFASDAEVTAMLNQVFGTGNEEAGGEETGGEETGD